MKKDNDLLLGISDLFTEKTLEEILCKVANTKEIKVLGWEFGDASAKGDSYLSTVNRVTVTGEADGKVTRLSMVVKSLPKNVARRKTFRSAEFFRNEIKFYTEILPKYTDFLKTKAQSHLLVVPRCLAAVTDGENDFIALEDVSVFGFGAVTRQSTLTLAQCYVILKALARFHGVSMAFRDENQEAFRKMTYELQETYWSNRLWNWYDKMQESLFRIAKDALKQEYPNSDAERRFNAYDRKDLYNTLIEFCNRAQAPTSVITQGDSWAPNFLVRDGDGEGALMLDFQLARPSSPILDLSFFIFSCTSKSLRDDHYDELLQFYHAELVKTVSLLGSNSELLYSWEVFMNEVKEQSIFGVLFSLEAVPFAMLDSSEAFDLDTLQGEDVLDVTAIWKLPNIKNKEGRRRLAGVIVDAVARNYL